MNRVEKTCAALADLFPEQESETEDQAPEGVTEEDAAAEVAQKTERTIGLLTTPYEKNGSHIDILCEPGQVVEIATRLDTEGYFLESISGVDWLDRELIEIVYDYTRFDEEFCRVTVRVEVPRAKPSLPTISAVIPGADWHERETYDFYGVIFEGHPNLTRILLPEDADFFSLLKDYMP